MIDEKRIKEAATKHMIKEYCDDGDWPFPCDTDDIKSQCELDFKDGAEWAQEEFIKSLWHDASEIPYAYYDYLVKTKRGYIEVCFYNNEAWSKLKEEGDEVIMWLDLHDINLKI